MRICFPLGVLKKLNALVLLYEIDFLKGIWYNDLEIGQDRLTDKSEFGGIL